MKPTENLNVDEVLPIISPNKLKKLFPAITDSTESFAAGPRAHKNVTSTCKKRLRFCIIALI